MLVDRLGSKRLVSVSAFQQEYFIKDLEDA